MPRTNTATAAAETMYITFPDGSKYYARPLDKDEDAIVGINKQVITLVDGSRALVNYDKPYKTTPAKSTSSKKKDKKKGKK